LSAADVSTVRGVNIPAGKTKEQCTVTQLCDMMGAHGGKLILNKKDLVYTVKQYRFLEKEVSKTYVDRDPNPNASTSADIDTSSTRSIGTILTDLNAKSSTCADAIAFHGLIEDTHRAFNQALLDDKYDNIARIAPELKSELICKEMGHIGSSIASKNIGKALQPCMYGVDISYHGLAFVPNSNKGLILSKCQASMTRDKKTCSRAEEGEMPKKQEYLLLMELQYKKTNENEQTKEQCTVTQLCDMIGAHGGKLIFNKKD